MKDYLANGGAMSDDWVQSKVEELLRQRIGLNPESIGSRSIMRAVHKGMRAGKMQRLSDYLKALQESPELFEALVESIVVPETSFFRNRASFVFLRQWVSQEWKKNRSVRSVNGKMVPSVLRVLSVPCSTGEEPYSIAIALREEGLSMDEFHIDAVDISEQAIAKAKRGVYSPYAFRRQTHRSDDKYFTLNVVSRTSQKRVVQRYHLSNAIREKVAFIRGNLLEPKLLSHQQPYDIVFCRNLLIYFDKTAREQTMAFFDQKLKPDGLLFVGYAETGLLDPNRYRPVPYPQTFAYCRKEDSAASARPSLSIRIKELPSFTDEDPLIQEPNTAQKLRCRAPAHSVSSQSDRLATAQQLADSGEIEKAAEQCDGYLLASPADAKAHLLRGELYQATNNLAAAESCFEKATYLNSQLVEALMHLMLIKEARGDLAEATVIRDRIQRIEKTRVKETT